MTDGWQQSELYIPVFDTSGRLRAVFELYEPVNLLNAILIRAAVPIVAILGLLFALLAVALDRLVTSAQADINGRISEINDLRKRLESFDSLTAVEAARSTEMMLNHWRWIRAKDDNNLSLFAN